MKEIRDRLIRSSFERSIYSIVTKQALTYQVLLTYNFILVRLMNNINIASLFIGPNVSCGGDDSLEFEFCGFDSYCDLIFLI